MDVIQLLEKYEEEIVEKATGALERTPLKHYKSSGSELNKQRLKKLSDLVLTSIKKKNLIPLIDYIQDVAQERFESGFPIYEVLTAINVLEEAMWKKIVKELPPSEFADSIGMVSTVLGSAKTTLATTYVSLAGNTKIPTLDLSSLFKFK
ncbi:MAG: hypothetical protein QG657_2885 [Acidobacteriota bacterium]|nr:hypothetical protein [Acidobacteriota bacterium]